MAPAAASGVYFGAVVSFAFWPLVAAKNAGGLRNASSSFSELSVFVPSAATFVRATSSSSIECPKR